MNRKRLIIPAYMFACVIAFAAAQVVASPAKQPKWQTIKDSGVLLEYQPGDENLARELLPKLVEISKDQHEYDQASIRKQIDKIAAKKPECLQFIAVKIGLAKPGKNMKEVFGDIVRRQRELLPALPDFHSFRLWNEDTLKEVLRSGTKVPSFSYDPIGDRVIINCNVDFRSRDKSPLFEKNKFPISYHTGDSVTDISEQTRSFIPDFIRGMLQMFAPWVVFHETAEAGIVFDCGIRTAYRRWFCDGAAQCVVEMAAKEFLGQSIYEDLVTMWYTSNYQEDKPKIDLLAWRGLEWEVSMPGAPGVTLNTIHYAFATQEIRGLVERHGPDVISKVIKHLSKLEADDRDSFAIMEAIKAVTGEDMEAALGKYGQEAQDDFRGLAIRDMKFRMLDFGAEKKGKPVELKPGASIKLDGKHDIDVTFEYEILNSPVNMRVEIAEAADICHVYARLDGKGLSEKSVRIGLPKVAGKLKPGLYKLRVLFDGKLFDEIPVMLVKADNHM